MKLWHVDFMRDATCEFVEKAYVDFPGATIYRCTFIGTTKSGKYKMDKWTKPVDPSTCFATLEEAKAYAEKCFEDEVVRRLTIHESWYQKAQKLEKFDVVEKE